MAEEFTGEHEEFEEGDRVLADGIPGTVVEMKTSEKHRAYVRVNFDAGGQALVEASFVKKAAQGAERRAPSKAKAMTQKPPRVEDKALRGPREQPRDDTP